MVGPVLSRRCTQLFGGNCPRLGFAVLDHLEAEHGVLRRAGHCSGLVRWTAAALLGRKGGCG